MTNIGKCVTMPSNLVKSFSKKSGKPESEVERLWDKAKGIAMDRLNTSSESQEVFALTTGILKRMLKLESSLLLDTSADILFEMYTDGTPHRIRQTPINNTSKIFKRDSFLKRREDRDKEVKKSSSKTTKPRKHRPTINDVNNTTRLRSRY